PTRVTRGAISLSSSNHFPLKLYSEFIKPVTLPPGRAKLSTKPAPTGSSTPANTIGTLRVCWSAPTLRVPAARITSGASAISPLANARKRPASPTPPANVDARVAADSPSCFLQSLQESRKARLPFRVVFGAIHEYADAAHAILLRARRAATRPRRRAT